MLLNVTVPPQEQVVLQTAFQFPWARDYISYLKINIPGDPSRLYYLNYQSLLHTMQGVLWFGPSGRHSWLRRLALVKMDRLP